MTAAQRIMLFNLFSQLAKKHGWGTAQREVERERITRATLGCEPGDETPSWSSLTNRQVDKLKARMQLEIQDDLDSALLDDAEQLRDAGDRKRLLYSIGQLILQLGGIAYAEKICRDLYDTADIENLPTPKLANLRNTLANRARRRTTSAAGHRSGHRPPPVDTRPIDPQIFKDATKRRHSALR